MSEPRDDRADHDARDGRGSPRDGGSADPLAGFSAAWRALEPPDPTASLDAPDRETSATIDWLRAAWQASAPAAVLPWALRRRLARRRIARALPWLAAAALVVLASWLATRERPRPQPEQVASQPASPRVPPAAPARPVEPLEPPPAAASSAPLVPVTVSADRMELRSGNVRILLFTPSQESNR